MTINWNPYEVLGVQQNAPISVIKKAYKDLAKEYHPDINKTKDGEEMFKKINLSHQILTDSKQRAELDDYINSLNVNRPIFRVWTEEKPKPTKQPWEIIQYNISVRKLKNDGSFQEIFVGTTNQSSITIDVKNKPKGWYEITTYGIYFKVEYRLQK